jgi:hypothetical protein
MISTPTAAMRRAEPLSDEVAEAWVAARPSPPMGGTAVTIGSGLTT